MRDDTYRARRWRVPRATWAPFRRDFAYPAWRGSFAPSTASARASSNGWHITSTANVGEIPGTPETFLVTAPWNAFAMGLNIGPSGSAATALSTSSFTPATTLGDTSHSSPWSSAVTSACTSKRWIIAVSVWRVLVMFSPSHLSFSGESGRSPIFHPRRGSLSGCYDLCTDDCGTGPEEIAMGIYAEHMLPQIVVVRRHEVGFPGPSNARLTPRMEASRIPRRHRRRTTNNKRSRT